MSRSLRYTFILVLVAVGAFLAALSGWRYARASAPVNGPIVVVSVDALRADRLPVYGYAAGRAPAIDSLAKDGIVFERAYSQVPQTLPAHASLLTGRLPFEHGVRDGAGFTLSASERSLAEMLRDRGYATGAVVSSFLLRKSTGIDQGFTFFDDDLTAPDATSEALTRVGVDSERIAERWFDSADTTRAFLFLHLADPSARPPWGESGLSAADYDAAILQADDAVGRLVRYLKAHQLYDQSTIILVADHGQGLGDHGETEHGALLYDEALHVPLIIKQAAGAGTGRRVKVPVQHIDIVPTILDLAKAPGPGNLQGRSLVPLFEKDGYLDDRVLYAESLFGRYHFNWTPLVSVTDGHYRLIRGTTSELFDLDTDPASRHNAANDKPEVMARLQKALADIAPTTAPASMAAVTATDTEWLERLGYVGTPGDADPAFAGAPVDVRIVEQYRRAVRLSAAGELVKAVEAFRSLTSLAPSSSDAWRQLARTATRAERHDVAAEAFQRVVELTPALADGYLGAAQALLQLRKHDDARQRAQAVVDQTVGDADAQATAHELLARIALGRRNYDAARSEAAKAEELDASRPVAAYVAGRIAVEQRRYADALAEFEKALEKTVETKSAPMADLRIFAAEALSRAERPSEAEYLFLEQLKDTPLNARVLAGLTALYKASGRNDEAARLSQH